MVVTCALTVFAFTTVLGWAVYGERCVIYLIGDNAVKFYRILFCLAAGAGCIMKLDTVWLISDTANAMMAFPNLIGILLLSPKIVQIVKEEVLKDPRFVF
jgi:AGCS family alanine or glycine:cation symporter